MKEVLLTDKISIDGDISTPNPSTRSDISFVKSPRITNSNLLLDFFLMHTKHSIRPASNQVPNANNSKFKQCFPIHSLTSFVETNASPSKNEGVQSKQNLLFQTRALRFVLFAPTQYRVCPLGPQ